MSQTELPSSVLYSTKDLGPGTLSRSIGGLKITENRGIDLKRLRAIQERTLHLQDREGNITSVVFVPSEETDVLGFYSPNKPTTYAARNGEYVEIGVLGQRGKATAQYALETGDLLGQEIDTDCFPTASLPLTLSPEHIQTVVDVCAELRIFRTPEPTNLHSVIDFLRSSIYTSPPSFQGILL